MNSRPSKRRRLSPASTEPKEPHANGTEATNNIEPTSSDGSDVGWSEDEGGTDGDTGESAVEKIDSIRPHPEIRPSKPQSRKLTSSSKPSKYDVITATGARPTNKSFFELQMDDLLREVKPNLGKSEIAVEETLRTLKAVIEEMPDIEPTSIAAAERRLLVSSKVSIPFPFPRPRSDAKYKLAFAQPSYVNVVGSYALKTASKIDGTIPIDLVLQMPSNLFTEKDYLNHRYFHKRAYYLACVAAGIQKSPKINADLKFSYLNGNSLLPIIVAKSKAQEHGKIATAADSPWLINILLTVEPTFFPRNKTLPNKNCVRPSTVSAGDEPEVLHPTSFYNSSLRLDASIPAYLKLLHSASSQCPGFRDACYLGRIWLRQRGMSSLVQEGGFGHFEWAALMALLLLSGGSNGRPALEKSLSAHQLFSSTVNFLAGRNLAKQPQMVRPEVDDKIPQVPDLPMLFDGATGVNILYKMTKWSYNMLRQEARTTAIILSSNSGSRFESIFIVKISELFERYDLVAKLPSSSGNSNAGSTEPGGLHDLYNAFSKGLGDRVSCINIIQPKEKSWPFKLSPSASATKDHTLVGILVDPNNGSRAVDRGPAAEDTEAAASFRQFWGDKAELRRFRDGQILESVVWEDRGALNITKEIISYLAGRHAGEKIGQTIQFAGNDLHNIPARLQEPSHITDIQAAYLTLESQLRALDGLPLQIRQIQRGGSDTYISTNGDGSQGYNRLTQVVVHFEGSARWPDDIKAIQMTKMAFLLKMSELLKDASDIAVARTGIENEGSDILNKTYVDVVESSGAMFRIRIHHDREQTLLEKRLADKSLVPLEKEEAARALSLYKRRFVQAPLHVQAIQKLTTRFPALSGSIRLVKAWFDAHLLTNHVSPEAIDIITARTFTSPHPWSTPSSVQTGFLRTLVFLSRWDWHHEPFIADFGAGMKAADYASIYTRFEAWRKIDPLMNRMALFVATDSDPEGTTWTEYRPAKVVAARMKSLATAACRIVREKSLDLDIGSLFRTSLTEYDFVLNLNQSFTGRRKAKDAASKFKNLQRRHSFDVQDVGFDPVRMFSDELESVYTDSAVFFYGQGKDVIAGLWSPHTVKRTWKVNLAYSTIPTAAETMDHADGDMEVTINKKAILSEIARLGGDLVTGVEMHR